MKGQWLDRGSGEWDLESKRVGRTGRDSGVSGTPSRAVRRSDGSVLFQGEKKIALPNILGGKNKNNKAECGAGHRPRNKQIKLEKASPVKSWSLIEKKQGKRTGLSSCGNERGRTGPKKKRG